MANTSNVKLTIAFIDRDWEEEERETEAQRLLAEMFELDEVENVYRPLTRTRRRAIRRWVGFW